MKFNKKALAVAIAGALVAPSAMAAKDDNGMEYTSAAEGLYGSIRVRFNSGKTDISGANVENSSSRIGIGGSSDLGGGLEGFYKYEVGVGAENGSSLSTRLAHVGLRGGFGSLAMGSVWSNSYNFTYGSTDIANVGSGNLAYSAELPGRASRTIQYTSPEMSGFQASIEASMDGSLDGMGANSAATSAGIVVTNDTANGNQLFTASVTNAGVTTVYENLIRHTSTNAAGEEVVAYHQENNGQRYDPDNAATFTVIGVANDNNAVQQTTIETVNAAPANKDSNDIDWYAISAKYAVQGFSLGATYTVRPDALDKTNEGADTIANNATSSYDDLSTYVLKAGYGQDNWNVSAWYAKEGSDGRVYRPAVADDDLTAADETAAARYTDERTTFSIAADVTVDQVKLYALHENIDNVVVNDGAANATLGESEYTTLGVQYNLSSRSRAWLEYAAQDLDADSSAEDYITIGLRHDF